VTKRVCGLIALVVLAGACSRPHVNRYRSEISANQQALARLALGMSTADVRGVMGEGESVRYKKLQLVDPWRTESFRLTDGTGVLILYCVTAPRPRSTTPRIRAHSHRSRERPGGCLGLVVPESQHGPLSGQRAQGTAVEARGSVRRQTVPDAVAPAVILA